MNSFLNKKLLSYSDEIPLICNDHLNKFDLVQFNYFKIFNDGGVIYLCNNKDWLKNYLIKGYPLIGAFEQDKNLSSKKIILWSGIDDPIMKESREMFGFHNGITIIKHGNNFTEFFNFGSSNNDPAILNEIINRLDFFEKFIKYFHDKSLKTIMKASDEKLYFSNCIVSNKTEAKLKKFCLGYKYNFTHLTTKELECLKWIIYGKTSYEISLILDCNQRTIETHVENVKQKLQCNKLSRLGYLVAKLGIDMMWEDNF